MRFLACVAIVVLSFSSRLHAQYDDLLRNPNITWVAEYTTDFEFNPVYNENLDEEYNLLNVIRLENQGARNGFFSDLEISRYFSQTLLNDLNAGHYACFADDQLQQPLTPEQVEVLLNPRETYYNADHGDTVLMIHQTRTDDVDLFRVRQVFYFEQKKRRFGSRLIAISPLINRRDPDGNLTDRTPAFWIQCPAEKPPDKKTARTAAYVFQTYMKDNAPGPDHLRVKKGKLDLQDWVAAEVRKPSHACYSYDAFQPLDQAALQNLVFTTDTISPYDDEVQVVTSNAISDVERIRFVQNWIFDGRRHRLYCRLTAAAPLAAKRDSEGNFRYYKPLFYVKY